jgi:hypothetical protein
MPIVWWSQLIWLFALALTSFLVTWIFADQLRLTQAAFIGVLAVVTGVFLTAYLSWSNADWGEFLSHQWLWGLVGAIVVGPLLAAMLARGRHSRSPMFAPAPKPRGLRLVSALLWEGLVYGVAEGLLLSVLPTLVTWQALSSLHWTESWYGVVLSGILALIASVAVIVIHHLGYPEFRGRKLPFAIAGCVPLSLVYLLTMNPLAAAIGHSILHTGAVLSGTELPPHQQKSEHVAGSMMPAH